MKRLGDIYRCIWNNSGTFTSKVAAFSSDLELFASTMKLFAPKALLSTGRLLLFFLTLDKFATLLDLFASIPLLPGSKLLFTAEYVKYAEKMTSALFAVKKNVLPENGKTLANS